jgi:hypothetical protein
VTPAGTGHDGADHAARPARPLAGHPQPPGHLLTRYRHATDPVQYRGPPVGMSRPDRRRRVAPTSPTCGRRPPPTAAALRLRCAGLRRPLARARRGLAECGGPSCAMNMATIHWFFRASRYGWIVIASSLTVGCARVHQIASPLSARTARTRTRQQYCLPDETSEEHERRHTRINPAGLRCSAPLPKDAVSIDIVGPGQNPTLGK